MVLVSASGDGTIAVWDVATGELVHSYRGHSRSATALSPPFAVPGRDGTVFASASADRTVQLWDTATFGKVGLPMNHGSRVTAVSPGFTLEYVT